MTSRRSIRARGERDGGKTREIPAAPRLSLAGLAIEDTEHSHESAARAVELVRAGKAQALMKGSLAGSVMTRLAPCAVAVLVAEARRADGSKVVS